MVEHLKMRGRRMEETWRWFGPQDTVSIDDIAQAGATGVVSALHHIRPGHIWPQDEIDKRHKEISFFKNGMASQLSWRVVESLPVSEDIKQQSGNWQCHIKNFIVSMENIAASGVSIICYNFMPVLDWTRTELAWPLSNGARCMRFDLTDFVIFDVHILKRPGAKKIYSDLLLMEAEKSFHGMSKLEIDKLATNIVHGLPGAAKNLSIKDLNEHITAYSNISEKDLRKNFVEFLSQVAPVAQDLGLRLCCHPDDPPFPLLGLPRILSTEQDYKDILEAVDIPANGITLCSGSLGARHDNDLIGMMDRLGDRVHFLHLRNVKSENFSVPNSFHETNHLNGNIDMVSLIAEILNQEKLRRKAGRKDFSIPFRPDHGHEILDDLDRRNQPGYSAIGRLKGLAELRGVTTALSHIARDS